MELLKKILSSSLWLLIGNSIGRLAMFLANIFAARMLSQESFGQFAMIRNTISSVEGLISGTLGSTVIKKVAETSQNQKENLPYLLSTIFIVNIVFTLSISLIIFSFSEIIVEKFFLNNTTLISALYIGVFILIFTTFANLMQNILIGFDEFKKIATLSIITSTISIPLIFTFIYFFEFYGALFGVMFYFGFDFLVKYILFKKLNYLTNFNFTKFKNESKRIILFSTPLLLGIIITSFTFWYSRVLIINQTNSFKDIAIFDAAFQWLTIIMIITGATTNVALSMLSKDTNKNSKKIFLINLLVNFLLSFFIALFFILFSKQIMGIYGNDYLTGTLTLKILAITSIFFTLSSLLNKFILVNSNIYIIPISSFVSSCFLFVTLFNINNLSSSEKLSISFFIFYLINFLTYTICYFIVRKINENN